ncbi:esterase, partial [Oryctes borbonicus]
DPILIWTAVIEPDFGQERFLTEHPVTSAIHGRFAKVPTMLGITEFEFGYVTYLAMRLQWYFDLLNNDYKRVLPIIFNYERNTSRSNEISTSLKRFHFGGGVIKNTTHTKDGIEHIYADGITGFPVDRATKLISSKNTENTYYYCFTYRGRYSFFYLPDTNNTETVGAVHHDDLMYLFYMSTLFPYFTDNDPEWDTVNKLVKMWTSFVITGFVECFPICNRNSHVFHCRNPTPRHSSILNNVRWKPYSKKSPKYLEIGDDLEMKENLYEHRYRVWEKLFPLSNY